jgi:hypothetical protein
MKTNKLKHLVALMAALTITGSFACTAEETVVDVIPVTYTTNFTMQARDLAKMTPGRFDTGAFVASTRTVELHGKCNIRVGYLNMIMYISVEDMANECARKHLLSHELTHIEIYKNNVSTLEPRIKEEFLAHGFGQGLMVVLEADKILNAKHDADEAKLIADGLCKTN